MSDIYTTGIRYDLTHLKLKYIYTFREYSDMWKFNSDGTGMPELATI